MAAGLIHYADLHTPPAPCGRAHYAGLDLPQIATGRTHHAEMVVPAASTASGRVHQVYLDLPAPPDAAPPSGVRQFNTSGAWWDLTVRQRTTPAEWI